MLVPCWLFPRDYKTFLYFTIFIFDVFKSNIKDYHSLLDLAFSEYMGSKFPFFLKYIFNFSIFI